MKLYPYGKTKVLQNIVSNKKKKKTKTKINKIIFVGCINFFSASLSKVLETFYCTISKENSLFIRKS